jgi:S-DNA-T family DNA segregation ATPase FtsK/SpoIIIE
MSSETLFQTTEDNVKLGLFFSKIDEEKRTVSGFATLDNVDSHGDIIDADGSVEAFRRFRGGLREMHTNNAVGTIVSFEEMKKYNEEDDKVYRGVYISARVSKGAQDTWEKVLDGTLKGFSIGGKIKKREVAKSEDGKSYPVIKEYDLIEVSLVDNPANPLANVLTVQKLGDTYVYSDADLEKESYAILYQESTGDIVLSSEESKEGFTNIGWVESDTDTEKIKSAVEQYNASKEGSQDEEIILSLHKKDVLDAIAGKILSKEVLNMPNDIIEKGEATEEAVEETVEAVAEEAAEEVVEEASDEVAEEAGEESADEAAGEEVEEVEKSNDASEGDALNVDDIVSKIQEAVVGAVEKAVEAARESKEAAESVKSSFDETLSDVVKQISGLKGELEGLVGRVESVESTTAVKKSSDILVDEEDNDEEETNFWRGSGFLSATDLLKG